MRVVSAQYLGLGGTVASLWSELVTLSVAGLASRQEQKADRPELGVKRHGG